MTPSRSPSERCCAIFQAPSSRSIRNRRPTMARDRFWMYSAGRRVGHRPGLGPMGLVGARELVQMGMEPSVVRHDLQPPLRVHGDVVPGRHDLPVLALGLVPGGRDIRVRALEDGERDGTVRGGAPMRIGARDVKLEHRAVRLLLQDGRDVGGVVALGRGRDERGQLDLPDGAPQDDRALFPALRGDVQRDLLRFGSWPYCRSTCGRSGNGAECRLRRDRGRQGRCRPRERPAKWGPAAARTAGRRRSPAPCRDSGCGSDRARP